MRRRIQIETDDISDFLDEQRIVRQLKRLAPMGLQPERMPNATDGHVTQADGFRHVARTPVRRAARRGFERAYDHLLHLIIGDRALRPGSRLVIQSVQPLSNEAAAPLAHRRRRDVQPPRHELAVAAFRTRQNDSRAPGHVRCRPRPVRQRIQSPPFVVRQNQRDLGASHSHARLLVEQYERAAPVVSLSTVTGH